MTTRSYLFDTTAVSRVCPTGIDAEAIALEVSALLFICNKPQLYGTLNTMILPRLNAATTLQRVSGSAGCGGAWALDGCLPLRPRLWLIRAELLLRCAGFGEHIDNAVGSLEGRAHHALEERR